MSTALAIAGVTATLRNLLQDAFLRHDLTQMLGGLVDVTVKSPDLIQNSASEPAQLNVFLRQLTPNAAWRNAGLPAHDASGRQRQSNPPLALDLHYLLSAYGGAPLHPEVVLGCAMQTLHEHPLLTQDDLRRALISTTSTTLLDLELAKSGLEHQVESLRISPEFLNSEETSKFWSATLAHFRPCAAYVVSVVLIQATEPAVTPRPVLARNIRLISQVPTLEQVIPAHGEPGVAVGFPVVLVGRSLGGTGQKVRLKNEQLGIDRELSVDASKSNAEHLDFTIPESPASDFPVGVYRVSAAVPANDGPVETNQLAFVLAPRITQLASSFNAGAAEVHVEFLPALGIDQRAVLLLGQREHLPEPASPLATALDFIVPNAPAGTHLIRLRIDGLDSSSIDHTQGPPAYHQVVIP